MGVKMRAWVASMLLGILLRPALSLAEDDPWGKNLMDTILEVGASRPLRIALPEEVQRYDGPALRRAVTEGVMDWIDAVRRDSPVPLPDKVEFIKERPGLRGPRDSFDGDRLVAPPDVKGKVGDQTHADYTVILKPGSGGGSASGLTAEVNCVPGNGTFASDMKHEIGHSFGMEDEYGPGLGGNPDSVMSSGNIARLHAEDVRNIRRFFREALERRQAESPRRQPADRADAVGARDYESSPISSTRRLMDIAAKEPGLAKTPAFKEYFKSVEEQESVRDPRISGG
jgi:hypothetical protein